MYTSIRHRILGTFRSFFHSTLAHDSIVHQNKRITERYLAQSIVAGLEDREVIYEDEFEKKFRLLVDSIYVYGLNQNDDEVSFAVVFKLMSIFDAEVSSFTSVCTVGFPYPTLFISNPKAAFSF